MRKLPVSVLVLSIIGIVFGLIGLCGNGFALAVLMGLHFGPPNPVLDELNRDSLYVSISGVSLVINLILTFILFAGSIGSFKLLPWARKAMLTWACANIAMCILGTIFNFVYVFPKMFASAHASSPAVSAGMTGGIIGSFCGIFIALIFPICILYFYSRTNVLNAFQGIFPHDPTNFPVIMPNNPNQPLQP